jgi:hypothetical protein
MTYETVWLITYGQTTIQFYLQIPESVKKFSVYWLAEIRLVVARNMKQSR